MYDLSKLVFLEESSKGYTVRLTLAGLTDDGKPRGSVAVKWFPFVATENKSLTQFNAETAAHNLMNNLLDIIEEVSGKDIPDQLVGTIKAEW